MAVGVVIVLAAGGLFAQTDPPIQTVIIPAAGDVLGVANVRWKTNLQLRNDTGDEVVVFVSPANDPDNVRGGSLPVGESFFYPDVVAEAFGMDGVLVPLMVRTEGRRSVTILATAYGIRDAEVFPAQPIPVNYGPTYFPIRALHGLSFSDDYRTNIGLANLGTASADFLIALQRIPGRNLAVSRITLQPNALWHRSIQDLFPTITAGDNFTVVVETGARDSHIYASVIDNSTQAARFVQPAVGTSLPR
jgi:hypothetical protein